MLHSRIVPAFVIVAVAHAALIAALATANRAPAPRTVQSTAIVAQLLAPAPVAAHVAAQADPKPAVSTAHPASRRPQTPAQPPRISRQHASAPPAAPSAAAAAPATTAPANQPMPAASPQNTSAQSAAGTSAASAAAPPARQTIAIAAPKRVEHADCRIVKPTYPELSKRRGETGTASVRFIIGTTGTIDSVALSKSSGFSRLDDAALEAIRASACQPYLENGSPVRASYVQAFTFGLDGD